jgi:hypothetical protein
LTVLDLIDGRIAELDRLTAEAVLDGGVPAAEGQELGLLLVALRALRQHKLPDASVPATANRVSGSRAPVAGAARMGQRFYFF